MAGDLGLRLRTPGHLARLWQRLAVCLWQARARSPLQACDLEVLIRLEAMPGRGLFALSWVEFQLLCDSGQGT